MSSNGQHQCANVILVTAPSGSGKSTIVRQLMAKHDELAFSVSATTRPPRPHETDGKDYYFVSNSEFQEMIQRDELIEWQEVYKGRFYGTMKSEVSRLERLGRYVLFDIDVRGAYHLQEWYGKQCLSLFIKTPSLRILADRLIGRSTEGMSAIRQRMRKAHQELGYEHLFHHTIVNDDLDIAVEQANQLVMQHIFAS